MSLSKCDPKRCVSCFLPIILAAFWHAVDKMLVISLTRILSSPDKTSAVARRFGCSRLLVLPSPGVRLAGWLPAVSS